MKGCQAHWTSKLIALGSSARDCLNRQVDEALDPHKHGGISKDGTYAWLYHGSYLEVISTRNGERLAAWCFGVPLKDPTTSICCCEEFVYNGSSKLVVSTDSVMGDMLLLFDVHSSKVIKAIQMPYKVTSLEVVSSIGIGSMPDHVLSEHLRHFSGTLAVGTHCGHLYLIDMNLDSHRCSDELEPAVLTYIDPHTCNILSQRYQATSKGNHLCLQLAEDANKRGSFFYKKPDDDVVKSFPADEVFVSCMRWIPQTGQLVVGFNFGSFQLWRLKIPVLEYTSRYEDDTGPVSHIAYTEPENDPRNFCYLWISRGPLPSEHQVDYNSYIALYQLGFNKKTWHDGHGYHFQELTSVGSRFEHELSVDPFNRTEAAECGSRLVSCYTLNDSKFRLPARASQEDSFEEGCGGPDLSLTVFVWEAGYADPKPSSYLTLFDMNRWYHAQMPYNIRPSSSGRDICPYFVFYGLEEVMNTCNPAGLMGVHVPYNSLNKFHSQQIPAPEQHFYPSALAFDVCFLVENGMVHCKYLGLQRQLLSDLQQKGPVAIVDPTEVYVKATIAGLLPRTIDVNTSLSQLHKREALLSLTLEYGLALFLNSCVTQFASGDFVLRGCTLRFLLEWTWKKVSSIKDDVDRLCVPLYDWSGTVLDKQTLKILHQHYSSLNRLVHLLNQLMSQPATQIGHQDLEMKHKIALLIKQHLQMLLWFYSAGFLPENSEEERVSVLQYAYPASVLKEMYKRRRTDVLKLHSGLNSFDVLHIDRLVQRQGSQLKTLLEKEGGGGSYPFSSFHALLNMYLLDEVSLTSKLCLTFYVLCDLFSLLSDEEQQQFNDKMQHFAQTFSFSVSLQKFVQGIWLLDHKDFKDALAYLLDPCLSHEIEPWQHRVTIKAYLYQGHHQLALRYIRMKKPPLTTPEDVKLRLTTLLANGLTSEAFEYQRLCRDQLNADDLLSHLFVGSIQTKTVDQLLQLPFTEDEEHHLVNYLKTSKDLHSKELLVMYYLQRSRFIEAIRLNQKILQIPMDECSSAVRERASTRKHIVDGYHMVLPKVQRKLSFGANHPLERKVKTRKFTRPKPLSTTVNRCERNHTITRATLLQAVLDKTREVRRENEVENGLVTEDLQEDHQRVDELLIEEPGPFVCTPATEKLRKRVSEASEVVFASTNKTRLFGSSVFLDKSVFPAEVSPTQSPLKRPYGSISTSPQTTQCSGVLQSARRKLISATDLTLLQTPPVKKRTPPSKRPLLRVETPKTPQSILKVRHHPLRRSPSPQIFAHRSKSELVMPTPPAPRTRLARMAASQAPASPKVSLPPSNQGTPKQLRFSMPNRGETPTPEKDINETTPSSSDNEEEEFKNDSQETSPVPRPSLRDDTNMDTSSNLKSLSSKSQIVERSSVNLTSKTNFSSGTSKTTTVKPEKDVDTEVTFNFAEKITRTKGDNDGEDTEPLSPLLGQTSTQVTSNVGVSMSLKDSSTVKNISQKSTVICLDEDSSEPEEHKEGTTPHNYNRKPLHINQPEEIVSLSEDSDSAKQETPAMETESSEEEHKGQVVSAKTVKYAEVVSSRKYRFSFQERNRGIVTSMEEVVSSEEEHKEIVISEDDEGLSSQEEHKETVTSEEDGQSSQEEHKETVTSEVEEQSSQEEHKETVTSEEDGQSSQEEHKEVPTSEYEELSSQKVYKEITSSKEEQRDDVHLTRNIKNETKIASSYCEKKKVFSKEFTSHETNIKSTTSEIREEKDTTFSFSNPIKSATCVTLGGIDTEFAFSKPLNITFDVDGVKENDEYENLHLELEDEEINNRTESVESKEKSQVELVEDVVITPAASIKGIECTKEQADSSVDQMHQCPAIVLDDVDGASTSTEAIAVSHSQQDVQKTPKRSPGRPAGRRRTPNRVEKETGGQSVSSPSRRRSMRIAAKEDQDSPGDKTPVKKVGRHVKPHDKDSSPSPTRYSPRLTRRHKLHQGSCAVCSTGGTFRTPPRPTRLAMPPTPPESSSPASTSSSVDIQEPLPGHQQPEKPQTPNRRGRAKARTPPRAPTVGQKSKARSRSSSPPVVTSTTEDLPGYIYVLNEENKDNAITQTQPVNDGPLSSDSFMMTMRSGRRISREPSPQGSEISASEEAEFTFSNPQEIQSIQEEFEAQTPTAPFVFSPPLTRHRSRRLSITSAATPTSSSIDLIPQMSEHELLKSAATKLSQSPAKRPRKTSSRSTALCMPTDSPINFVPETEPVQLTSRRGRGKGKKDDGPTMTLRTRGQLAKVQKKMKKPVAW